MTESPRTRTSYSVSLISQGDYKFYSLTVPSDVLGATCFVSTRDDDPIEGFQRDLDEKRAIEIANYIDSGQGSIPTSIILSAQAAAELFYDSTKKTLHFNKVPKAFLILDGQHRVWGFNKAKTSLRVPVIIYNNLSRQDESRLFIDINTKQKPVSNALLLDIKKLAAYETEFEEFCRDIFDSLQKRTDSPLLGLMNPSKKQKGKISRVTFNESMKKIFFIFEGHETEKAYEVVRDYLRAITNHLKKLELENMLVNPIVFRAFLTLLPEVATKVKDRFDAYTSDNFFNVLGSLFSRLKTSSIDKPPHSYKALYEEMSELIKKDFSI